MSGAPGPGRAGVREALEIIGLRAVLLGYWGTTSVLARRRGPRPRRGESVRQPFRTP
ncbi:hypothetical protein OG909_01545 [Streptomyces sp. NBC_01754]|uniref:hypothetical protein n=1 Tax=Streptomyces sp. NBC_01754 TaxID=2975930 RepID=UPI002DD8D66C|nr:hypothetical protein [Streptomyces sp. NBC_01754]WSC91085.1 hypothetical protein OG909_01545 [Streptomyces sp. NBC_01754]